MSGGANDDTSNVSPIGRDSITRSERRSISASDVDPQIMTIAYAIGVIVFSIGIVILTITMAVLSFLFPDKANSFLVLLASPIALLVISNTFKVGKMIKMTAETKEQIEELKNGH